MHAMGRLHVLDDGRRKHLDGGRGSLSSIEHDSLFDVGQHRSTQLRISAPRLTPAHDVANGVFLRHREGGRHDGQRLHRIVQVDSHGSPVAPNMTQHPPFPLALVERFQQRPQFLNGVHIGHVGGPSERQKGAE